MLARRFDIPFDYSRDAVARYIALALHNGHRKPALLLGAIVLMREIFLVSANCSISTDRGLRTGIHRGKGTFGDYIDSWRPYPSS